MIKIREIKDYDIELLAAIFHKVYQDEAWKQEEQHKGEYINLSGNIKEIYKLLAKFVLQKFKLKEKK